MATEETMLAKEALFRDLARHVDSVDESERRRIERRMIDTVWELIGCEMGEAVGIVDNILRQDPSSASQLRIKGVDA